MRLPASLLDPVRGQRWFVATLAIVFVAVSVQYSFKVLTPREDGYTRSAINRWSPQLQALEAGENINQRYSYPNPPVMALMLWPFSELPPLGTALTWFYLKVIMTLLALRWTFRMVETPESPFPPWAKALTVALSLRMILSDLSHGNVNLLILFLMVASLYAFRCGRDHLCGNILALAIACKLTPALFIGYFVWKRAWNVLIGCAVGLLLYFIIIPSLFLGFERNWELLTSWVQVMVLPFIRDGFVTTEHNNQSLPGLFYRLLTVSPSFSNYVDGVYTPTRYDNFMALSTMTVQLLLKGLMAVFALIVVLWCRAPVSGTNRQEVMRTRGGWPLAAECALILIGMLLFSERTWKHHAVTLLVPFAVICYALASVPLSNTMQRGLIASLVIATVGIALTSTGMWPDWFAKMAQVYGGFTLAFLVLAASLVALLVHEKGRRANLALPRTMSMR